MVKACNVKDSGWSFLILWGLPMGIATSFLPSRSEKTTLEWVLEKLRKSLAVTSRMVRSSGLDGTTH